MKKNVKYINGKKVTIIKESEVSYNDDILPEYDFSKAKPFRERTSNSKIVVELDPEVARYFQTSKQVNLTLKAIKTSLKKNHLVSS
jgi:hypothetical protein